MHLDILSSPSFNLFNVIIITVLLLYVNLFFFVTTVIFKLKKSFRFVFFICSLIAYVAFFCLSMANIINTPLNPVQINYTVTVDGKTTKITEKEKKFLENIKSYSEIEKNPSLYKKINRLEEGKYE